MGNIIGKFAYKHVSIKQNKPKKDTFFQYSIIDLYLDNMIIPIRFLSFFYYYLFVNVGFVFVNVSTTYPIKPSLVLYVRNTSPVLYKVRNTSPVLYVRNTSPVLYKVRNVPRLMSSYNNNDKKNIND